MIDADALKRRVSLAAVIRSYGVELKKQGSKLFAHCPFHDDSKPSFSLYDHHGTERAGCKGCDWDGDAIQFVQAMEACDFATAAARLEEFADGVVPEDSRKSSGRKPEDSRKPKRETKPGKVLAEYDYTDAEDKYRIFQVVRRETLDAKTGEVIDHKHFSQRRPDDKGGWVWNLSGVVRQLYRLQAVCGADTVWIVEGEKDVHSLEACGVVATTNAGGAKAKWEPQYTETLRGKHVIICGDSDAPGRERDATIAVHLHGVAASVRMVRLPEGLIKDVTDWLEAGQTVDALLEMAEEFTPPHEPEAPKSPPPPPPPRVEDNGGNWREKLLYNHQRNPKPSIYNVEIALRYAPEWRGVLGFSEFSGNAWALKLFPGGTNAVPRPWTDNDDTQLTVWLHEQGINVSPQIAGRAVQHVATDAPFHPVRKYLQGLSWDGIERLTSWLMDWCGVEVDQHAAYVAAVGSRWLISAVARVFQPGCKADCCLILEGSQGIRKSTALRILGGEWFTDELAEMGSKDSAVQAQGAWIIEISELDAMRRSEVERVKAFMSRSTDRFRPPYGHYAISFPRQCVFAASTNKETYLPDETGNRRFWPVACSGEIRTDELAATRDQLWAEAYHLYQRGCPWWLDGADLVEQARLEQMKRYDADPWQQLIRDWLESRQDVSVSQILSLCIAKPAKDWTQMDRNRVAKVLRADGWIRYNARNEDAEREWRYRRGLDAASSDVLVF